MIAVCGIGSPKGRLNSATTAYQSARPPMVAASANAAMKPNTGCTGSSHFAATNSASVAASTAVASHFTRRSSAARCASPGASMMKLAGRLMAAFAGGAWAADYQPPHCERREAIHAATERKNGLLRRFAPRNDVERARKIYESVAQK